MQGTLLSALVGLATLTTAMVGLATLTTAILPLAIACGHRPLAVSYNARGATAPRSTMGSWTAPNCSTVST